MSSSSSNLSPRSRALDYLSNPHFHQRFTLPGNAHHDALLFSYADVGRVPATPDSAADIPTILLMPGMIASRYFGTLRHTIAEKWGVRILVVDRPGIGHSANVPLQQRVPIWLELVPSLLAHLGIKHVALVSHSAGVIYLLNTLYHCREILHPERPCVTILAPWVDPSRSRITSMRVAQLVPKPAFSIWNRIPPFMIFKVQPVLRWSGALLRSGSELFSSNFSDSSGRQKDSEKVKTMKRIEEEYGVSRMLQTELNTLVIEKVFEENTVGVNDEALLCLKKGGNGTWGVCDDNAVFVHRLVDLEKGRRMGAGERGRLKVRSYFAESDAMIGDKGRRYVEECWGKMSDEEGHFEDVLDFETTMVAGVDHDSLAESLEILEQILADAGGVVGTGHESPPDAT